MNVASDGHGQKSMVLIGLAFVLINGLLFFRTGPMVVGDSHRYLEYAEGLRNGFYIDRHNIWYFGYVSWIWFIRLFSSDVMALVISQYVLAFAGVICLYRASLMLYGNKVSAYITLFLFFAFAELSVWNAYVLAESVFVSMISITLYCALAYSRLTSPASLRWWLAPLLLLTMLTALVKPTGIAVAGVVLFWGVRFVWMRLTSQALKVGFVVVGVVLLLIIANRMLTTYLVMENYALGEVIYDARGVTGYYGVDVFVLDPPKDLVIPAGNGSQLVKILSFIIHYPFYWGRLFFTKIFFLLAHVRPFWSWPHNLLSLSILIPSYILAAINLRRNGLTLAHASMLIFLLINILSVGITSEDWDGRFLMPMLPIIFLLAGNFQGAPTLPAHRI